MSQNQIIDAWLETATKDLCDAAKERIGQEIRAHFNDAVAAHEADGQNLETAQRLAVEELGDAKAAAKRFRNRHLTVKEDEFVNQQVALLVKKESKLILWIAGLAGLVFYLIMFFNVTREEFPFLLVCVGMMISHGVTWTYCQRLAQSFSDKTAIKQISLIYSANAICWSSILFFFASMGFLSIFMISTGGVWCAKDFRWLPIYFKMRSERMQAG